MIYFCTTPNTAYLLTYAGGGVAGFRGVYTGADLLNNPGALDPCEQGYSLGKAAAGEFER